MNLLGFKVIKGVNINLEPLAREHIPELCECLLGEPDGWFATRYGLTSPEALGRAIEGRLIANSEKKSVSFVSRDLQSGRVAGLSHFLKPDEMNRQLEIGGTQVGRHFRKTYVNTETKLLMLQEAFERLNAVRVYFKIDPDNHISQQAILRTGAKFEGEFRNDAILPDGRVRNYRVYSIIDSEWSDVRRNLRQRLALD